MIARIRVRLADWLESTVHWLRGTRPPTVRSFPEIVARAYQRRRGGCTDMAISYMEMGMLLEASGGYTVRAMMRTPWGPVTVYAAREGVIDLDEHPEAQVRSWD